MSDRLRKSTKKQVISIILVLTLLLSVILSGAFCDVALLIGAAAVFASGMKSIGLTGALVDAMKGSQSIAMVSAAIGPWLMAIVCGSGNAAALAFNEVKIGRAHV